MNLFPHDHPIAVQLGVDLNKVGMIVSSDLIGSGPHAFPGSVLVMGDCHGFISTPGTLYLAPGATLLGGAKVGSAVIAGQVAGDALYCRGPLTLKNGADLSSDVVEYGELDFAGTSVRINCFLQRRDFDASEAAPIQFVVERYTPAASPDPRQSVSLRAASDVDTAKSAVSKLAAPTPVSGPASQADVQFARHPGSSLAVARQPGPELSPPLADGQPMNPMRPPIVAPFIAQRHRRSGGP